MHLFMAIQATGTPLLPVVGAKLLHYQLLKATPQYLAEQTTSQMVRSSTDSQLKYNQNPGIDNPTDAWDQATNGRALVTHIVNTNVWDQVETSLQPVLLSENDIDTNAARTSGISNKVFGNIGYIWSECNCWTPYLGIGGEAEFGQRGCYDKSCKKSCGKSCDKDCNKSCNTSCNTGCNTSCNTSCNTGCNTSCNTSSCNTSCNTGCNTSCNSTNTSCSPCNSSCCDSFSNKCCQKCSLSQWGVWIKGGVSFN